MMRETGDKNRKPELNDEKVMLSAKDIEGSISNNELSIQKDEEAGYHICDTIGKF